MATKLPTMPRGHSPALESKLATPIRKEKKKVLTVKEWKFVQELVMGDGQVTMREAAIRAGYSPKSAKETARILTDPTEKPHIVAAIQELRHDMAERYGTTMERHMRDLQNIRDLAIQAGAFGAAVQAEFRRGQALGSIYIDRKEIRHGTIDSMSKEEVLRKLEEIKRMYGDPSRVIDITPAQVEASLPAPEPQVVLDTADELDELMPEPEQEVMSEPEQPEEPPGPPRRGRPLSRTSKELLQAHIAGELDGKKARERVISEAEGKPVRLPFHPPRKPGRIGGP